MVGPDASWMPIGELSRRVGVSPDLLRKWERRYGVLRPGRTIGNRRVYSRVDEARIRLMVDHVRRGVSAAQAAELATAARFSVAPGSGRRTEPVLANRVCAELLAALERFDETAADQALEKLQARAAAPVLVRDVFLPLLRAIGDRWAAARLSVAQEHFATTFVHARLLGLARGWDRGLGPRALLTCAPGEQHVLGLIAFGIALHHLGWRITYLGADTPVTMVADAAAAVTPRLVVVTAAMPGRLEPAADDLRMIARRWPLAVAGAGTGPGLADAIGSAHLAADPVTAAGRALV